MTLSPRKFAEEKVRTHISVKYGTPAEKYLASFVFD